MKQMFAKFPGIIFMDNTYNVCSKGYILNAILVEDQDSSGKPVAYSFIRRETKECLEKIIDIFCEQNDTSKANDIMVDKDLTEINLLEEKIPHAHIQICSFHVLKYFKSKVAKLKIKQDEKSELIQLLREILILMMRKSMKKDTTGSVNSLSVLYNTMMTTGIWARCFQQNVKKLWALHKQ